MGESRWSKVRCTRLDRGPSQESWRVLIIVLGSGEALHVMRTDPKIASRFESHALPAWVANEVLRRFLAGFLQQLDVDPNNIVRVRLPSITSTGRLLLAR